MERRDILTSDAAKVEDWYPRLSGLLLTGLALRLDESRRCNLRGCATSA